MALRKKAAAIVALSEHEGFDYLIEELFDDIKTSWLSFISAEDCNESNLMEARSLNRAVMTIEAKVAGYRHFLESSEHNQPLTEVEQ